MVLGEYPYTYSTHRGRYWRFRRGDTDMKLPGKPGTPEFSRRHAELMERHDKIEAAQAPKDGTFAVLIKAYKQSAEYRGLATPTQLDYGKTLDIIDKWLGEEPYRLTTRAMIKVVRDKFASTPRKANKIKQMASRLYSWADEESLVPEGLNPTKGLKKLKAQGGPKEYVIWSDFEFDLFLAGAITPMQTAAMIARYTGQRVQDVVKMVWTDLQGPMVRVRQSKTGAPLIIPCHAKLRTYLADLKRTLDAEKKRGTVILTNAEGRAYNANSLSSAIGREVRRIKDMPADRSLHGLRYMAGSDMAEAGCNVAQIEAVLGHQTFKMALKYASQRLRAEAAIAKVENKDGA